MKTSIKFNHEADTIHEGLGYTSDECKALCDKANHLIDMALDGDHGQVSKVVEGFVKSDLTRDELAILLTLKSKG